MSAASRFLARLEPVLFDDEDGILEALAIALMAPRELLQVARADDEHDVPWGAVVDPDAAPVELLGWLAMFAGVELPPSALSEAEKRYRIQQSAGRYRGTPRAVIEELQLVLTGTKTVYLGFHTSDQWHYSVATIDTETPDPDAVERAVLAQKPAGMLVQVMTTGDWTWFVLAPTLIGKRVDDDYVIDTPEYPTWTSVAAVFTDWTDLVAGP